LKGKPLKTAKAKGRPFRTPPFPKIAHERAPRVTFNAEVEWQKHDDRREEKVAAVVVVEE